MCQQNLAGSDLQLRDIFGVVRAQPFKQFLERCIDFVLGAVQLLKAEVGDGES